MVLHKLQYDPIPPPSMMSKDVPAALDDVVLRGLARDASQRYQTAEEMAIAIESAAGLASAHVVGQHVRQLGGERLQARAQRVAEIESVSSSLQLITGSGFTGSGVVARSPQQQPSPEPKKSEWWKILIFAGALLLLLPLAWFLTHRSPAPGGTAISTATPTATSAGATTASVTATAPATATATVAATVTAAATATAVPTSTGKKTTKPAATTGSGKLYGRE